MQKVFWLWGSNQNCDFLLDWFNGPVGFFVFLFFNIKLIFYIVDDILA